MPHPTPAIVLAGLALSVTLAAAEPQFVVRYPGGVPQVSITGDYTGSTYTVWRGPARGGDYERITDNFILCLGTCYAEDRLAVPGTSYHYLFDVTFPAGSGAPPLTYGPYLATISPALAHPVGVFVYPNPGRGVTGIQLHLAGTSADRAILGEVAVYDVSGRRLRTIHRGEVPPGLTTLSWDGRDDRGAELRSGVYLLRFATVRGEALARIVRR